MGNNRKDWRSNISYSFIFSIKKLFFFQNVSLTKAEAHGRVSRQDGVVLCLLSQMNSYRVAEALHGCYVSTDLKIPSKNHT